MHMFCLLSNIALSYPVISDLLLSNIVLYYIQISDLLFTNIALYHELISDLLLSNIALINTNKNHSNTIYDSANTIH